MEYFTHLKSFFFLPKPPRLILHEEIDYVEFQRHIVAGSNMHYFDLLVRLKTEQEHLFRNIQRSESHHLLDFISLKGLKIMCLSDGPGKGDGRGVRATLENGDDDAFDPHLAKSGKQLRMRAMKRMKILLLIKMMKGLLPMIPEGKIMIVIVPGSKRDLLRGKRKSHHQRDSGKKPSRDKDEDGSKKRKQKKKKDPNASKKAISGFIFFSQAERENLKKENPGIAFTDVGRILGEKWRNLSAEEKEPYKAKARADKKRYSDELGGYEISQSADAESGDDSD